MADTSVRTRKNTKSPANAVETNSVIPFLGKILSFRECPEDSEYFDGDDEWGWFVNKNGTRYIWCEIEKEDDTIQDAILFENTLIDKSGNQRFDVDDYVHVQAIVTDRSAAENSLLWKVSLAPQREKVSLERMGGSAFAKQVKEGVIKPFVPVKPTTSRRVK